MRLPNEQVTDEMVDKMSASTLVDVVPLIPAVPAAKFVSVTLYVDDKGSVKNLPINERATGECRVGRSARADDHLVAGWDRGRARPALLVQELLSNLV